VDERDWVAQLILPTIQAACVDYHHRPSLPYKQIINIFIWIILSKQYFVQPYLVGKEKRSLAMIMPFELVRSLNLAPHSVLFLLKVMGNDQIQLLIVRKEDLKQKVANSTPLPVEQENKEEAET
jgi:hypothetical protein